METTLATASERQVWITKYLSEYVRASQFKPYMGKDNTNIIIVKYEMETQRGKVINIPLITRLKGAGVTGNQVLEGNEEELGNYNVPISIDFRRHAVTVPDSTQYKTEIDLLDAAKPMLRQWEAEQLRDDLIQAFMAIIASASATSQTKYGTITDSTSGGREILAANYIATESEKNTWLTNNTDRVLFGATKANTKATHALSTAELDTTNDRLTAGVIRNAKLIAKLATGRRITPYMTKDGKEYYVLFTNPFSFADAAGDATIVAANTNARPRDVDSNPIFQDGDLIYNGVIIRQVEEFPKLTNAGLSGTTDVGFNFLAGAQAVGVAWGIEPTPISSRDRDYGFRPGVGIKELLGVSKLHFDGIQQGGVTVYTAVTGAPA